MSYERTVLDELRSKGFRLIKLYQDTKIPRFRGWQKGRSLTNDEFARANACHLFGCVPEFANKFVIDFDRTPTYTKDQLKAMPLDEAQNIMQSFFQDLSAEHDWMHEKLLCRYHSGSGIGMHCWYHCYEPVFAGSYTKKNFKVGGVHCGEMIRGGNVVLYRPKNVLNAVNDSVRSNRAGVTPGDVAPLWQAKSQAPAPKPRVKKEAAAKPAPALKISSELDSQEIIGLLGTGEGIGTKRAIAMVEECVEDAERRYETKEGTFWNAKRVAIQLGKIPEKYWSLYDFRIGAGIALKSLSRRQEDLADLFQIWTQFLKLCPKPLKVTNQIKNWNGFKKGKLQIGWLTWLAGQQSNQTYQEYEPMDFTPIQEWIEKHVQGDLNSWMHPRDIYKAYVDQQDSDGDCAKMKTFTKVLNLHAKENGFTKKRRRGYDGWCITLKTGDQTCQTQKSAPSAAKPKTTASSTQTSKPQTASTATAESVTPHRQLRGEKLTLKNSGNTSGGGRQTTPINSGKSKTPPASDISRPKQEKQPERAMKKSAGPSARAIYKALGEIKHGKAKKPVPFEKLADSFKQDFGLFAQWCRGLKLPRGTTKGLTAVEAAKFIRWCKSQNALADLRMTSWADIKLYKKYVVQSPRIYEKRAENCDGAAPGYNKEMNEKNRREAEKYLENEISRSLTRKKEICKTGDYLSRADVISEVFLRRLSPLWIFIVPELGDYVHDMSDEDQKELGQLIDVGPWKKIIADIDRVKGTREQLIATWNRAGGKS